MPIYNANPLSQTPASSANPLSNSLSNTASKIANANPDRKGMSIYNPLSVTVYIDGRDTVTTSSYMFPLPSKLYYEMPAPIYTGEIWAVLPSGTGSINVRELV